MTQNSAKWQAHNFLRCVEFSALLEKTMTSLWLTERLRTRKRVVMAMQMKSCLLVEFRVEKVLCLHV
jgi:hypothetical protein